MHHRLMYVLDDMPWALDMPSFCAHKMTMDQSSNVNGHVLVLFFFLFLFLVDAFAIGGGDVSSLFSSIL